MTSPTPPPPPAAPRVTKKKAAIGSAWVLAEFGAENALRLIRSVILTRLIAKEMFGLLGLSMIVVDLVGNISDVGVNLSIMRQRRADEQRFLDTAWTLSIVRGIGVWAVASLLGYPAALLYHEPKLTYAIPLLALSAILSGAWSTKLSTANRDLRVGWVTTLKIGTRIAGLLATVAWALVAPDNIGVIIVGPIFSAAAMMIASFVVLPGPNNRFAWDKESLDELVRFGRWIFLSTLMTFFIRKGDLIIAGKLKGVEGFASYVVAYQIGNIAPRVFQALNARIIFPIYSSLNDRPLKETKHKVARVRRHLVGMFLPLLLVLTCFGSYLIDLLYPAEYHDAGWMLEMLAAGTCGQIIGASVGGILLAKGNSFRYMVWKTVSGLQMIACMFGGLWIGTQMPGDNSSLAGLIIGMGAGYWLNYLVLVWAIWPYKVWMPKFDMLCFAVAGAVIAVRYTVFA